MRCIDENDLSYELDEKNQTATVIWSHQAFGSITIPKAVTYDGKDYIIKSIHQGSFQRNHGIKSIKFSEDSELNIIHSGAFSSSSLEYISLPASLQKLEDGWNSYTSLNFDVAISPQNKNFTLIDNQFIVGPYEGEEKIKSKNLNNNLVFARHNINHFKIPSFIIHINSFAFSRCKKLKTIEFSDDSNLKTIDGYAFYQSSLEYAIFPKNINSIGQYSFHECLKLKSIEFLGNDNLSFDFECFCYSFKLNIISCPNANIIHIDSKYFRGCPKVISLYASAGAEIQKNI
ncbi:hypothetical protein M9Y10_035596 [Tritrichomonas musculus]|uniref:Surface antigen BspA-like n=1 Tax=Tritrichomonas musculus TaxID=1915356 RepID=A0ABR2GW80_9EUKA